MRYEITNIIAPDTKGCDGSVRGLASRTRLGQAEEADYEQVVLEGPSICEGQARFETDSCFKCMRTTTVLRGSSQNALFAGLARHEMKSIRWLGDHFSGRCS